MMDKRVSAQQLRAYLRTLGVETDIDFERERLYVTCVRAATEFPPDDQPPVLVDIKPFT